MVMYHTPGNPAMADDRLLATCWTTAGNTVPASGDQRSSIPLRERIEAASAAGLSGFGLHSADLYEAERRYGLKAMRSMFEDNGIEDIELEGVPRWWSGNLASGKIRHRVLDAAEKLGARHIKVTPDDDNQPWELGLWAAEFAKLAAQAGGVGARLGIEFLPWSNINDLRGGLHLVNEAGHDNGGVVLDVWHLQRDGIQAAAILKVPLDRITSVELNDAAADVVGSLYDDTVHRRRYCGEGAFDLQGLIATLRTIGWRGPWGIEILSEEHRAAPSRR
jgi:sugar phosphate isomerase/epimerase